MRNDLPTEMAELARTYGKLNLPPAALDITRDADGVVRVYDRLRRYGVALTPEEWVRQHFVAMMVDVMGYPAGLMANEVPITLNGTSRRCDTVVYSRQGLHPLMIVEYKAPHIQISQRTFDQIVRYNMVLRVPWLVVSNGLRHFVCRVDLDKRSVAFQAGMPAYREICGEKNGN